MTDPCLQYMTDELASRRWPWIFWTLGGLVDCLDEPLARPHRRQMIAR